MSVVIVHPDLGVYLGSCLGLGFWSKMDPVGQPAAVTFPSAEVASSFIAGSLDPAWRNDLTVVEVMADSDGYASIESCVRAGLEGWCDAQTPVANALPV